MKNPVLFRKGDINKRYITVYIVIVVLIFVAVFIFFFPKNNGGGGVGTGVSRICNCLGYEKKFVADGPWKSTCYGISYGCKDYNIFTGQLLK